MDAATRDRLAKVMAMTTSSHDAEALAAVRRANGILAKHQLRWPDVLLGSAQTKQKAQPGAGQSSNWQRAEPQGGERRKGTRDARWVADGEEYIMAQDICMRGLSPGGKLILASKDVAFLEGMQERLEQFAYGEFVLTLKTEAWLKDIDMRLRMRNA